MRAAQYLGDREIAVDDLSASVPSPGEVQIAVAFVGLCGTDLHIVHGAMDVRVQRPLVFGHEMSGVVHALGAGVTGLSIGDPVTVIPLESDGTCPACVAGHGHICHNLNFIGIDSPGALQGLWNVPRSTVLTLPESLPLDRAALVEPTAVAVHDVNRGSVSAGDRVVVIGGGPIGLLIATVARHIGASVLVIEVDAARRGAASKLGFITVDPVREAQAEVVDLWTGGAGADVVFEVSGSAQAVLEATALVKVRGRLVMVAIHPTPRAIDLQRVFWRELTIVGARVYERRDFEVAIELLDTGVIPADALITQIVPIDSTADAISALERGVAMKILVDVSSAR